MKKILLLIVFAVLVGCSAPLIRPSVQEDSFPQAQDESLWSQRFSNGFKASQERFQGYRQGFEKETQRLWNKYGYNKCE